jgi:outer membrane protein OmpU
MKLRNALLGTTAILGAAALVMPSTASAFEVQIRGFFNFNTVLGDLEESGNAGGDPKDYDFLTDSEIHIQGVNTDDETGIRYGFLVEFETDPQNNIQGGAVNVDPDGGLFNVTGANTGGATIDESWIFVDGAFGGFRLGNEDGAVDNSKIGAYNIAAGTGGIDGQGVVAPVRFAPINTGDSTKIRYDSPSFAGFTVHGSFTPSAGIEGNRVAQDGTTDYQEWVETALVYRGAFGGVDLQVGGTLGFNNGNNGADDYLGYNVGAILGFAGFRVAGSYWHDDDGPAGDATGYTAGAAATFGPADLSVTWADVIDADNNAEGQNLVVSATMGLLPGMSLQGDVAIFDRDVGGPDDGVTGVVRLRVAF